jgi:hypothetical protein
LRESIHLSHMGFYWMGDISSLLFNLVFQPFLYINMDTSIYKYTLYHITPYYFAIFVLDLYIFWPVWITL